MSHRNNYQKGKVLPVNINHACSTAVHAHLFYIIFPNCPFVVGVTMALQMRSIDLSKVIWKVKKLILQTNPLPFRPSSLLTYFDIRSSLTEVHASQFSFRRWLLWELLISAVNWPLQRSGSLSKWLSMCIRTSVQDRKDTRKWSTQTHLLMHLMLTNNNYLIKPEENTTNYTPYI